MKKFLLLLCISWGFSMHAQQFKVTFSPSSSDIKDDVTSFHKYGDLCIIHILLPCDMKMQPIFLENFVIVNFPRSSNIHTILSENPFKNGE